MTKTYNVTGMTCQHCVNAVSDEVGKLAGVEAVDVDLAAGTVTVTGDVGDDAVRAAVDEAGYELVDA
ncbi:MAG TPA: copper ion binding protein [Jatrophihabitantaceae bacterium]|jgi:copper ion binding protein|nr:copper ion binding protein [Jatrophihabitantaceae bacterium]